MKANGKAGKRKRRGGEGRLAGDKVGPECEAAFCSHANSLSLLRHNKLFSIDGLNSMLLIKLELPVTHYFLRFKTNYL